MQRIEWLHECERPETACKGCYLEDFLERELGNVYLEYIEARFKREIGKIKGEDAFLGAMSRIKEGQRKLLLDALGHWRALKAGDGGGLPTGLTRTEALSQAEDDLIRMFDEGRRDEHSSNK